MPDRFLSDEAHVLTSAEQASLRDRLTAFQRTWGVDIGVAILPSLNGRDAVETGVQIIRRWGVGSQAPVGDPRRDRGALILLVPKETNASGRGVCRVATTTGAEGVLTDATAGDACRSQTEQWKSRNYAEGLAGVLAVVEASLSKELTSQGAMSQTPGAPVSGDAAVESAPREVGADTTKLQEGMDGATIFMVLMLGGVGLFLVAYWHGASRRRREEEAERDGREAREREARSRAQRQAVEVAYRQAAVRDASRPRSTPLAPSPAPISRRRTTPDSGVDVTPYISRISDDDSSSRRSSSTNTDTSPSYGYDSSPSPSFGDSGSTSGGGGGSEW